MVRALGRLILVPLGFLLGVLATFVVLLTLGLELTTHGLSGEPLDARRVEAIFEVGFGVLQVFAAATLAPALLMVVVGEVARIRSVLYYVVGGGASVALVPLLASLSPAEGSTALPLRAWTVAATAGFAGGLVYWLIAGRRA